jgi:hypothetical protein
LLKKQLVLPDRHLFASGLSQSLPVLSVYYGLYPLWKEHGDLFSHHQAKFFPRRKQYLMLKAIMTFYDKAVEFVEKGGRLKDVMQLPVRVRIGKMKDVTEEQLDVLERLIEDIDKEFGGLTVG